MTDTPIDELAGFAGLAVAVILYLKKTNDNYRQMLSNEQTQNRKRMDAQIDELESKIERLEEENRQKDRQITDLSVKLARLTSRFGEDVLR